MSIKFNEVTWYSKLGAIILFILVVPILTFYIGRKYQEVIDIRSSVLGTNSEIPVTPNKTAYSSPDPRNGTYEIDGQPVTFVDGVSETSIPGSAATVETRIFARPAYGDLNGDGLADVTFFVSQETGGTGIFFYVVVAVQKDGVYHGLPAVFIGDRIAPQNINITNGIAAVNYAVRKDGEPMAETPSVGVTKYISIRNGVLVEVAK